MLRSLQSFAAVVVALGLFGAAATAHPPKNNPPSSGGGNSGNRMSVSGSSMPNRMTRIHYSKRCWFESCNCYCFFCTDDSYWYYWSEKDGCYYPKTMFPQGL